MHYKLYVYINLVVLVGTVGERGHMFLNFASGLNLYYAVQNLIAIPQQWLLTRERAKAQGGAVVKNGPPENKRR